MNHLLPYKITSNIYVDIYIIFNEGQSYWKPKIFFQSIPVRNYDFGINCVIRPVLTDDKIF